MQLTDNTILITGGGSGIGRGLAEAFHALGNRVIIAGRRPKFLEETTRANPGMESVVLDVADSTALETVSAELVERYPKLNVVVNNAGVSRFEDVHKGLENLENVESMITTNVLGPIRLTAALLSHLRQQPHAAILNVTSGLGFVPLTAAPTYSATKAALHSYTLSLRQQLQGTPVQVIEIIPPYVQTELGGAAQAQDPRAMPLADFIAETMENLKTQPDAGENCVERARALRFAEANGKFDETFTMLSQLSFDSSHP